MDATMVQVQVAVPQQILEGGDKPPPPDVPVTSSELGATPIQPCSVQLFGVAIPAPPLRITGGGGEEEAEMGGGSDLSWMEQLDPVYKLQTNVGARIRNCIRLALGSSPPPPPWAQTKLEWSISKELYKGNASGPTKRAAIEVLEKQRGTTGSHPLTKKPPLPPLPKKPPPVLLKETPPVASKVLPPVLPQPYSAVPAAPIHPPHPSPVQPPGAKDSAPPGTTADAAGPVRAPPVTEESPGVTLKPPMKAPVIKRHKGPANPALIMHLCHLILRQLATSDPARAFGYLWGSGLPIASEDGQGSEAGWVPRPAVSRPMDLRRIDIRLAQGAYGGLHSAVAADVRLVRDGGVGGVVIAGIQHASSAQSVQHVP